MVDKINRLVLEQQIRNHGYTHIAGIDEVGRGPLAGPVYACAVIFPENYFNEEVKDSKKLTEKKRRGLSPILMNESMSWAIGIVSPEEIDSVNIRQATLLAMQRAVEKLEIQPDYLLVDGRDIPKTDYPGESIVDGDNKSFTIASASIIAKVARDRYMIDLDKKYPNYKFASNKGYGTKEHIQAIRQYGKTPVHRKSFLTKITSK